MAVLELSTAQEEEEVWCECSDDELYNPSKMKKGTWQPKATEMLALFEELKTKKVLELSWTCPGRRPPESEIKTEEEIKQEPETTPPQQEEKKLATPSKFDFDDDMNEPKAVLTPRWTPGSTPRPPKKVAKMDKVLKDLMQARKQQAAEREARKLAKSPRAPGSPSRARLGSPGSSPRTPPVASQPNRQSPVRSVAPSSSAESVMTTPLRAPVDSESGAGKLVGDIFAGTGGSTPQSTSGQFTTSRTTQSVATSSAQFTPSRPTQSASSTTSGQLPQRSTPSVASTSGQLTPARPTPSVSTASRPSQDKPQATKVKDTTPSSAASLATPSGGKPKNIPEVKPVTSVSGGDTTKNTGSESMDTS